MSPLKKYSWRGKLGIVLKLKIIAAGKERLLQNGKRGIEEERADNGVLNR